jgi:hypothetical protein
MTRTILALAGILAAIAPVVIKGMAYTHFVTPDGSSTSACTQREPCSLTRAVSLIGSKDMPPGSTVLVQHGADGIYSQAGLTFAGSGTAGNPIKFVGERGVRLTSARVKPDPSAWTLVPGRTYTYQLDWDEVAQFAAMPVQRPPVANWRPIWVEDRRPPFTTPSSRRFDMWFPPLYSARSSIKEVEAQAGTAWSDTANNKVYVHLFDDTAPPRDGTNLYLMSAGWGAVTINGDYLWLENLTIEHATPEGLRVNTSATGTVLKRITVLAAIVNLRGTNTLAEDLNISHVIRQRTDPTECYDANPDFGVGECWNANATGQALAIGVEGGAESSGQVVRRAFVHRSWNGGGMHGANTLELSSFWGFPNHTLSGSGSGGVIRHNVFLNGQDSIYFERNVFDDLTVENNVFVNGALFWVSNNGVGGVPPKSWRFRYNILPVITYDDKTYPAVTSDCNLFIPSSTASTFLMKVTGTDGRQGFEYNTLREIQTKTPLEAHSSTLPPTKWTDGTLFRRFVGQTDADFDFSRASGTAAAAALVACGKSLGPTQLPTPSDLRIIR